MSGRNPDAVAGRRTRGRLQARGISRDARTLARFVLLRRCVVALVKSCTLVGIDAVPVDVECVDRARPAAVVQRRRACRAVGEGRQRADPQRAASAVGHDLPLKSVTVNLAPADLRKLGCALDLPIALSTLIGGRAVRRRARSTTCSCSASSGSTARCGTVRGVLAAAMLARERGMRGVIVPDACAAEALVVDGIEVYGARAPRRRSSPRWTAARELPHRRRAARAAPAAARRAVDMAEVRGQVARARGDRDRGRGRAQPAARRSARHRQDDARAPDPDRAAAR